MVANYPCIRHMVVYKIKTKVKDFQSVEEYRFAHWLGELKDMGLIDSWEYEPAPFILTKKTTGAWVEQLKTKTKDREIVLGGETSYTCDFKVVWHSQADGLLFYTPFHPYEKKEQRRSLFYVQDPDLISWIEIKPDFDFRNMTRYASTKIRWVLEEHGAKVDVVKIPSFFKKTFAPEVFLMNDSGLKPRMKGRGKKAVPISTIYKSSQQWYDEIIKE